MPVQTRKRKLSITQTQSKAQKKKKQEKKQRDPKIRQNLIGIRNEIVENRSELLSTATTAFIETIEKIDNVAKEVTHASDATLVVEQTDMMSSILHEQTRKCDANTAKITVDDLISVIRDEYMDDTGVMPDLSKLFDLVHPNFNGIPPLFCFSQVGGLEFQKKVKKKRQIKKKPELLMPEFMNKASQKEKEKNKDSTDTTVRIKELLSSLHDLHAEDKEPKNLLETMVSADSFAETIENIYDFSHVASEGSVKLYMKAGHPVYEYLGSKGAILAKESTNRQQFCLSFDGAMYDSLSQHLTQSQLPSRSQYVDDDWSSW